MLKFIAADTGSSDGLSTLVLWRKKLGILLQIL
jgi:hypothetical protein